MQHAELVGTQCIKQREQSCMSGQLRIVWIGQAVGEPCWQNTIEWNYGHGTHMSWTVYGSYPRNCRAKTSENKCACTVLRHDGGCRWRSYKCLSVNGQYSLSPLSPLHSYALQCVNLVSFLLVWLGHSRLVFEMLSKDLEGFRQLQDDMPLQ